MTTQPFKPPHASSKRGLIFYPEHVEMILNGKKTETRRMISERKLKLHQHPAKQPKFACELPPGQFGWSWVEHAGQRQLLFIRNRKKHGAYGKNHLHEVPLPPDATVAQMGTILYAREGVHHKTEGERTLFRYGTTERSTPALPGYTAADWTYIPARLTGFVASRCLMEMTGLRQETLGEITLDGAKREGYGSIQSYQNVWDRMHGAGAFERMRDTPIEVITFRLLFGADLQMVQEMIENSRA